MNELTIQVLGGLDLRWSGAGTPLDLPTRKSRAFLAYLALSPGMMRSREHLAGTFWHRSAEEQARASLRQTLSSLRRALPESHALIGTDADCVWLDARAVRVDALQFGQLAAERSEQALESAVALYRGELLGGFSLREEPFEQWTSAERRRYHERAVQAFSELLGHHVRSGREERAIAAAERLLALDPLLEWGHGQLIRLYLRAGRREAALRQYRECVRILQQELGIAPSPETEQLAAEIVRAPLAGVAAPHPRAAPADARGASLAPVLPAERKQLTVLCARVRVPVPDPDPETAFEQLDPVLGALAEVAGRFGGTISQVGNDGVTVIFGAPLAQEDHATRACYAALAMRDAVASLGPRASELRIGIHSGEAVVRTIGDEYSRHYDAVGPAPRLAALIDAALAAGEIGISAETARGAEGFIETHDPVALPVAGSGPATVFKLRAKARLRLRWEARSARGLARFVGREAEIARLGDLLDRALGGAGQVAALVGEPGMGKSRLVHEFVRSRLVEGCRVLETGTTSHETSATYLAVAQLVRAWFDIGERDSQAEAAAKLRHGIDALDRALAPALPALEALLDLPAGPQWAALSPAHKRRRTLEAVSALVMRQSQARPLVLVVEDLHWSDPGTQAVVDQLVDGLAGCRALLILTHRPEYRHAWAAKSYFTQLRLDPLGTDSADSLLRALLGDGAELRELRRQLIDRTGGTPLFLEESVRALADSGALVGRPGAYRAARSIESAQIPSSVQAVLAARIDRLTAAQKSVLQSAAVIGQEVPLELLEPLTGLGREPLQELLAGLQAAEFLYQSRSLPEPQYAFKHALTRRVAYESVLRERRRATHLRLLEIIEARFADRLDEHAERLAHHALAAQDRAKSVHYLYRSAGRAIQRSAHQQAIRYLEQGLELIEGLPDASERLRRELDYRKAIGVASMAAKGWAAAEVLDAYTRARVLSEDLGDERELFIALRGEGQYRMIGGQPALARRLGNRCIALADRSADVGVHLETHHLFWSNSFFMGEYAEAGVHCAKGVSLYQRERDHALTYVYSGHDPGVCCRSFSALIQCLCGRPDRSLETCGEALALARQVEHPLSTAIAYWAFGLAHILRDEPHATRQWAEQVIAVSDEYLLPLTRYQGLLQLGWALARLGKVEEGVARMREGVRGTQATGAEMGLPYFLALLGEALGRTGMPDAGLKEVGQALATAERSGARFQMPEMLRLKGELLLLLSRSNRTEAQACFREAIAAADEQGARLPKLRSAMSLARLLREDPDKVPAARVVLQSAYGAITEGRDTADLKAAAVLLEELRG
jgi:predicted ATPase/class 3 adenylate cyclase